MIVNNLIIKLNGLNIGTHDIISVPWLLITSWCDRLHMQFII